MGCRLFDLTIRQLEWRDLYRHFYRVNGEYAWNCRFFYRSILGTVNYRICVHVRMRMSHMGQQRYSRPRENNYIAARMIVTKNFLCAAEWIEQKCASCQLYEYFNPVNNQKSTFYHAVMCSGKSNRWIAKKVLVNNAREGWMGVSSYMKPVQKIVQINPLTKIRNFHHHSPAGRTAGRPVVAHRYLYAGISRSFL